jgi:hypothetical protein
MIPWIASLALAQTPVVSPAEAQTLWIVGDAPVEAKRYPDAEVGSAAEVAIGTSGTVLYREEGWVRLRLPDRFVWVPETSTSASAPATLGGLDLGGLDLGEGLKLGEGLNLGEGLGLGGATTGE